MNRRRLVIGLALIGIVLVAIVVGLIYYGTNARARGQLLAQLNVDNSSSSGQLLASGFIEAEEVEVAAELGGRVVALPFDEGDEVQAGDVLVQLDTALLEAQRDAAQAQLDITVAQRDLLRAGAREEIIRQAEAQVAIAQAAVDAADLALQDAVAIRNNPQELQIQLAQAETQAAVAQHQVNAAGVQLRTADKSVQVLRDQTNYIVSMEARYGLDLWVPMDLALAPIRYETATENLNNAQASLEAAQALLAAVRNLINDPQQLEAQVIEAQTALDSAKASLAQAQAQLDNLRAGPTDEQVRMADARVEEAQAALAAVETQIGRMTLYAPIGGAILQQSIHVGELAAPTVPLVTLANLDTVTLTVYIAEDRLDQVALNQAADITVDSFPTRQFPGTVVYISDEAEFTPRNVQTREERVNLVYAIKIRINNPDHALKPGMPADAFFEQQ